MSYLPAGGNAAPVQVRADIQPVIPPQDALTGEPRQGPMAPQFRVVDIPQDPRGPHPARGEGPLQRGLPARAQPMQVDLPAELMPIQLPVAVNAQQHALFEAINCGNLVWLEAILTNCPGLINQTTAGANGVTPLCWAASTGRTGIVAVLLKLGADLAVRSTDGYTPLLCAAKNRRVDVVRLMMQQAFVDLNATTPGSEPETALSLTVSEKNLDLCTRLILLGAGYRGLVAGKDYWTERAPKSSPAFRAITTGFTDLVVWSVQHDKLWSDMQEPVTNTFMINVVIAWGTLPMIVPMVDAMLNLLRSQPKRQANSYDDPLYCKWNLDDGTCLMNAWEVAEHFGRFDVIEHLASRGLQPRTDSDGMGALAREFKYRQSIDLVLHPRLLAGDAVAANGLQNQLLAQQFHKVLETMAAKSCLLSECQMADAYIAWLEQGLSGMLFGWMIDNDKELIASMHLLGKMRCDSQLLDPSTDEGKAGKIVIDAATPAQQLQVLVELASDACGHPEFHLPYSFLNLSPAGTQAMNTMLALQGKLLLNAVTYFRKQFAMRMAGLPELCLYFTEHGRVDEAGLYRTLTGDWGLHDPVARAAIRLLKEALQSLRASSAMDWSSSSMAMPCKTTSTTITLTTTTMTTTRPSSIGTLAAEPTAPQLRQAMAALLGDWDKIPEIVDVFREAATPGQLDFLADFLFQQWRLLCLAFDVEKERWQLYGPHKPAN